MKVSRAGGTESADAYDTHRLKVAYGQQPGAIPGHEKALVPLKAA